MKNSLPIFSRIARIVQNCFPGACIQCGKAVAGDLDLCPVCRMSLPPPGYRCIRCASELPAGAPDTACGFCLRQRDWPVQRCVALLPWRDPWRVWISNFKYHAQLSSGRTLSLLLSQHLRIIYDATELPEVVLPLPLHRWRLLRRGFNQSLEISRILCSELNLPLDRHSCWRHRATTPQVGLNHILRQRNVRGAFSCDLRHPWRRVALVDDVLTSGATVAELGRLLRGQGVEVHLWCLARA